MKRLYNWLCLTALLLLGTATASAQCSVGFNVYNYLCDMDSLRLEADPLTGQAPFSFIWETGETTQSIMIPFGYGDYMLTMTDAIGCTAIINCHVKPWPDVVFFWGDPNGCEGDTVVLSMHWVRDTIPGVTYLWNTGETTESILVTDEMDWSLTLTDPATGCEFEVDGPTIHFWPYPTAEIIGPTEIVCGEYITLTLEAGDLTHGIWEPGWEWSSTYTVTAPGTYTVDVWDPQIPICHAYDTIVITSGDIEDPVLDGPPQLCNGETGTVEVTNASDFDSFIWNTGETGSSIVVTGPGTYSVTATVGGGCTNTESITISSGGGLSSLILEPTNAFCGDNSGSIDLTAQPPQSFEYQWSNGASTADLADLTPGTYAVTVTDENGCTAMASTFINDDQVNIQITGAVIPNTSCQDANGSISLTVNPSTETYTFLWSNGETTQNIVELSPGSYTVTVSTGLTCTQTASFVVNDASNAGEINSTTVPSSCGLDNGSAAVSINGGQGPFTYLWSNGNTTNEINDIEAGNYTITVTGADGCESFATIEVINEDPDIQVNAVVEPNTSCNAANGEIDLSVLPANDFTYQWSNGSNSADQFNLSPGVYTVTVTLGNTCEEIASFTVDNNSDATEISATVTPSSCGENNGAIDISLNGGQSPFEYLWSSGQTTEDINDLAPGTYEVTITGADGCVSTSSVLVPNEDQLISIDGNVVPNTSCDAANGEIDLSVLPAHDYTYQWSNGSNDADQFNLSPGVYIVTVTLGNMCEEIASFTVDNNSDATEISVTVTSSSCGENNGAIDISLNGGLSPFEYQWSTGQGIEDIEDLAPGTYEVTVTGADGCMSTSSILVPNEDIVINIDGNVVPNTSCDDANGQIDIMVTPSGSYFYTWSNGFNDEDLVNLSAGTYSVTVSTGASCQKVASFSVTNQNIPFEITGSATSNTACELPNGSIDISVNPADSYTYSWSDGSSTEDLPDLGGGNYVVTVTNASGCSISSTFEVLNIIPSITISALTLNNTSCQVPNGRIDINIEPDGTYTYLWSDGSTAEDLQNISAGNYAVTITSLDGCVVDSSFAISDQSTDFNLNAVSTPNTSCDIPNGSVAINVTPSGAYTYQWSGGENNAILTGLSQGVFTVTVTDANSCSSTATISLSDSLDAPIISAVITPDVCNAGTGAIDLTTSGLNLSFLWSNGSVTEDLFGITQGWFSVIVTDSNGCKAWDTFQVNSTSNNFTASGIHSDNTTCVVPNGAIDLTITPSGAYSILWSNGDTTEDINQLVAGNYDVTITDVTGCSTVSFFEISDTIVFPVVQETIMPSTCGNDNGSITLSINPDAGNSFTWSNGAVVKDLSGIPSGVYSVTVTALSGCTADASFIVPDNNTSFEIAGATIDNSSCVSVNGSVTLTVTPAGSYNYLWSNGSVSSNLSDVSSGEYYVTVTDQSGCSSVASFEVGDITPSPELLTMITPASCGNSNGAIDLKISGAPVSEILWSNGMTVEDLINVAPGIYTVTVTSSNGCSSAITIEVPNNNTSFTIDGQVTADTSCLSATGAIDINVVPAGTYIYIWSDGHSGEDLSGLDEGIYEVTVTDASGCASFGTYAVEDYTSIPFFADVLTAAMCGESSGGIDLITTGSAPHTYLWSTGDITEDLEDIMPGHYSVTVTDQNACTAFQEFDLKGSPSISLDIDADLSALAVNGIVECSLKLNVPLNTIFSIDWAPDDMMTCQDPVCVEQIFSITERTEISVSVTDTNGCFATASLMLDVELDPLVFIPNVFSPNDDGQNDWFTISTNDQVEEVVILEIFDRWGNKVFVNEHFPPNVDELGWDGAYKSVDMDPAVFAYRAVVRFLNGGERAYKGDVTLLR